MNSKTRKMVMLGMLCALAYMVMLVGRVPIVLFLKYDPKDVIITIGGFIFGPMSAFLISLVVSLIEMLTVSNTGPIGFVMNVISTAAFACPAAYMYKRYHTIRGAVIGLLIGIGLSTTSMLLWNYLITPMYMGQERADIAAMLIPIFLPFNLIKGGLNMAITLLIYKPIMTALRSMGLLEMSNVSTKKHKNSSIIMLSVLIIATCILWILSIKGII